MLGAAEKALDARLYEYAQGLVAQNPRLAVSVFSAARDLETPEEEIEASITRLVKAGKLKQLGAVRIWAPV